ncbi:MAG: nucleoside kinase [Clostridiales Family XIII bacterium]|jgi:uridine kinase|nr:nucleoside kinase [Clostridiales Family XIII bacterium]
MGMIALRVRAGFREPFEEIRVEKGATLADVADLFRARLPYRALAARVDFQVRELNKTVEAPADITFLDMRTNAANLIYQRSLSLLFLKAARDVLGRCGVFIENSLNKGFFTVIRGRSLSARDVAAIEERMRGLVAADLPYVKQRVDKETAYRFLAEDGYEERTRMLRQAKDVESVVFYSLDGFRDYFFGQMAPSTGYIERFELRKYRNGLLVRFPHYSRPDAIPPYADEKKLYRAFSEASAWSRLMGISVAADLNERVEGERCVEMIQLSEALHEKSVAGIADRVTREKKRVVLIAGPSSSGKTTFARRLCIQLKVNGLSPLCLGTDDYFLDRQDTPLDEHGEPNFEDLISLDLGLFNDNLNALLRGEAIDAPRYDFYLGKKVFGERSLRLMPGQPIVIEGIHGLNGQLTGGVDDAEKFRIYISPLTALNIDSHNRIPTTDVRLLRRMVRDHKFRGNGARNTIATWPKVRAGEDRNIFPFSDEADVLFNSAHTYELAVLKKYATPLLMEIREDEEEYSEAYRLLRFLQVFREIEDDSAIVNNSILREFIGGSIFV